MASSGSEKDLVRLIQGAALVLSRFAELRPVSTGGRSTAAATAAHQRWSNATLSGQRRARKRESFPTKPIADSSHLAETACPRPAAWQRVAAPRAPMHGVLPSPGPARDRECRWAGLASVFRHLGDDTSARRPYTTLLRSSVHTHFCSNAFFEKTLRTARKLLLRYN